jgi:hypothetical protein
MDPVPSWPDCPEFFEEHDAARNPQQSRVIITILIVLVLMVKGAIY